MLGLQETRLKMVDVVIVVVLVVAVVVVEVTVAVVVSAVWCLEASLFIYLPKRTVSFELINLSLHLELELLVNL